MADTIAFEPPLVRDLGANPGKVEFKDLEALIAWIDVEAQAFQRVIDEGGQNSGLHHRGRDQQRGKHNDIRNTATTFRNHFVNQGRKPRDLKAFLDNMGNLLDAYKRGEVIHSKSAEGKLVLGEKDNRVGQGILGLFLKVDRAYTNDHFDLLAFLEARRKVEEFWHGAEPEAKSTSEAYSELVKRASTELAGHVQAHQKLVTDSEALNNKLRSDIAETKIALADTQKKGADDVAGTLNDLKAQVAKIEDFYNRQMSLQRPVRFWQRKAKKHRNNAWVWGSVFVAIVCVAIWLLESYAGPLIDRVMQGDKISLAPIVLVSMPAFFAVWLLRLVSRMFSLNIGLMWDARERESMASTFISLMRSKDGLKDAERAEVIKSLFRPAAVTSHDDGAPPSVVEALISKIPSK